MKLTCPKCEAKFDEHDMEIAEIFKEREEVASKLGPAWKIANEYVDAFRTKPGSRIGLKKRLRLLKKVLGLWESCTFQHDGKRYKTNRSTILKALEAVANQEKSRFRDHNYLKTVLISDAEKMSAEGFTAKEEQAREKKREAGDRQRGLFDEDGEGEKPISAKEYMKRHKLKSLTEKVGKEMP